MLNQANVMSGQRATNQKMIAFWAGPEDRARIDRLAKSSGLTKSELIRRLVRNQLSLFPTDQKMPK